MPSPRYISKNRHGAFIFRIKIPVHLLHLFAGRTVITKSLKTYHQPTALRLARRYAAKADELFFQLEMKSKYLLSKTIQKARRSLEREKISDLTEKLSPEALKLLLDIEGGLNAELEEYIENIEAVSSKLLQRDIAINELDQKIIIAHEIELRKSVLQDYGLVPAQSTDKIRYSPPLSEAMVGYISAKEKSGHAKKAHPDKAIHKGPIDSPYRGYTASFRLLLAAAGNIKTGDLSLLHINDFKNLVAEMKNANHREIKPLLRFDYGIHKFAMPLPDILNRLSDIDAPKLSQKTIEEYYSEISIFIGWLGLENEFIEVDACRRIQTALAATKVPKNQGHAEQTSYKQYTVEQLQLLFKHPSINPVVVCEKNFRRKPFTPADFWIPILALFTGARARELAQLFTADIHQEDGIWCISIKPEEPVAGRDGKSVKTSSSIRLVPIHQKLIDIGLLDYCSEQRFAGEKHLFPELRETKTGQSNPYKGWGQDFRRAVIQKHLGIPTKSGEVFHSFRGTLITELERRGVDEAPRKRLAGHSKGSDAHARYSGGVTLHTLQALLNRATFEGLDFDGISWSNYKSARLLR